MTITSEMDAAFVEAMETHQQTEIRAEKGDLQAQMKITRRANIEATTLPPGPAITPKGLDAKA